MCKLLAIVEIENQKNAEEFARRSIPIVTKSDNHGLGIMRLGENGVHVQRWLEPPTIVRRKESKVLKKYEKGLRHQKNEAGKPSKELHALAIHGRFATCARTLENVHPFLKDGTALMHNGIISNAHEFERTESTCDSEALLSQYLKHGVKATNEKLTEALDGVQGYQAAIVFNDNGVIDIWRDATASLHIAHVRGIGVVLATTAEIITATAKKCKAYITGLDEILPFTVIRWTHGLSPAISEFECKQPAPASYTTWPTPSGSMEVIERHKASVSDAQSPDAIEEQWRNDYAPDTEREDDDTLRWWEIDDDEQRQAAYNEEARRNRMGGGYKVAKRYQEEIDEEDKRYLDHLYDMKRGGNK